MENLLERESSLEEKKSDWLGGYPFGTIKWDSLSTKNDRRDQLYLPVLFTDLSFLSFPYTNYTKMYT